MEKILRRGKGDTQCCCLQSLPPLAIAFSKYLAILSNQSSGLWKVGIIIAI